MTERPAPDLTRSAADHLLAMEQELINLRRELEHTQRLSTIGTITAGVAHEINNLLTPALAYTQRATGHPERTDFLVKAVTQASDNLRAATQILQAILGFAAARDSAPEADLADVLQAALDCLGRDLARDGILLRREIPERTIVAMPPLSLQQTILNLILNARKALTGAGGGSLTVSAVPSEAEDEIIIRIIDDGPGIPPEIQQTLFEPFISVDAAGTGKKSNSGTGLGLAVCRRAVEAVGGSISASATPGHGATITMRLPARPAEAGAQAEAAE